MTMNAGSEGAEGAVVTPKIRHDKNQEFNDSFLFLLQLICKVL